MRILVLDGNQNQTAVRSLAHAVILTGVTSLLHWRAGNVDPHRIVSLLIGSIPGGILGSYLSTRVPVLWLRRILCAVLLMTGARMLWTWVSCRDGAGDAASRVSIGRKFLLDPHLPLTMRLEQE
jgi:uncharacterized membrane protein YfcA